MRERLAVGCCLGLIVLFVGSGLARPFGNGDEVIYAQNVKEMLASGDFTTLHWNGIEVLQRPSLPFALASLGAAHVAGEVGLRLSSTLASLALLALLYAQVMSRFGRRDAALLAVITCAGVPTYHAYGALLLSDPPFLLGTTLAVICALRALTAPVWIIGVGIGIGWAIACKSLAAAVVVAALAPLLLVLCTRRGPRPSRRQLAAAVGSIIALGAPFYVVGLWLHGRRFFEEHVMYSLVKRASGQLGSSSMGGPLSYLRWSWESDGPVSCVWLLAAVAVAGAIGIRRRNVELIALAWLPCALLALYSALGSRLPHYLLPIYPIAALALAYAYCEVTAESGGPHGLRRSYAVLAALGVLLVGQWSDAAEQHLKFDPAAVVLGRRAGAIAAPGETIFAHEWYAPAFGYYAQRPFKLATNFRVRYEALESVDFFRAAHIPAAVPPAPVPIGSTMLVAGPLESLLSANWLAIEEQLAASEGIVLVRARAVDPRDKRQRALATGR